ncbi:MAG: hypothetical protein II768_04920 [Clostridia bacterium]|nr:hypothetical protein [Clostridia bacterium]
MKRDRREVLYNILLPVWLLLFWPTYLWLLLIPANYLIDRFVLKWSLGELPERGLFCRKNTWKICLAGFLGDFAGVVLLFGVFMLTGTSTEDPSLGAFFEKLGYGVGFNPFSHLPAFLVVTASVALAGVVIFFLDRAILKKAGLDPDAAKRSALRLAIITAPYLYFFPSAVLYNA